MPEQKPSSYACADLVIGGGIAGIVTALELLEGGRKVLIVDRDSQERFGGLARWAFGGMALVGTPLQQRFRIADSPELALQDWVRFGELEASEHWPMAWAKCYVEESKTRVYDWLTGLGMKFMPAVNWVERGSGIKGNSVPRYHLLWGTGRELVNTLAARLDPFLQQGQLTILHLHRVNSLRFLQGSAVGCSGIDEASGQAFRVDAENTVIATGGINGSEEQVRKHWPGNWPAPPEILLNGAHPFSDGAVHEAAAQAGAQLTHLENMWNYAAGIPHPQAQFKGHGLSLVPCKTVLWLSPDGDPLGPAPMVTGFDTRELCRQVAGHPYSWQVLNWKIAKKELAISGSEHNPRILRHQLIRFLLDTALGSDRLLRQMVLESTEFLVADTVSELAEKMNRLSGEDRIDAARLDSLVRAFDETVSDPEKRAADPATRRILKLREWRNDAMRTCNMQPIADQRAGPLLAIRLHFISRKSLGGLQTDLECRVLDQAGKPMPGLYAVGEAAGFGGGGTSGKRSLEGTFLSGCILTGRRAAAAICRTTGSA
jgi:predicted oxidoreductase